MVDLKEALKHPDRFLFLDIETTGLSPVYDIITVIGYDTGKKFSYALHGESLDGFKQALSKAHAIVTFNGTLFDTKFIKLHFPDITFPEHHIDLRYIMRRVGYTGGQKQIERDLGLSRDEEVQKVTGYEAVMLWHEYRRGDKDALRKLLSYNHADVQGMKEMLKFALRELGHIEHEKIAEVSTYKHREATTDVTPPVPKVYAKDLWKKVKDKRTVVGIDITGSELRPSGFALLHADNSADTSQLWTDKEIIDACVKANCSIVSIDSPLGIPKGRTMVTDDDPMRWEIGIMRWSERELKRRGVNVYPCLIPSMQRLTARGMKLAKALRKKGIRVIESYPGAAQDIMQIPRKHAGLPYLKDGLHEFGIKKGRWYEEKVSHDELDAITSAIVGLFFLAGKYEALGNDDEEYLVIPKV